MEPMNMNMTAYRSLNETGKVSGAEETRRQKPNYYYVYGIKGSKYKNKSIELSKNKFAALRYDIHGKIKNNTFLNDFNKLNDDCKMVIYDMVIKMKQEEAAMRIQDFWRTWKWIEEMRREEEYGEEYDEVPRWYRALEFAGL